MSTRHAHDDNRAARHRARREAERDLPPVLLVSDETLASLTDEERAAVEAYPRDKSPIIGSADRAPVPNDPKACTICGDTEPFHVHNEGERIENYFTVGRGQTDFEAAQAWKRKWQEAVANDHE